MVVVVGRTDGVGEGVCQERTGGGVLARYLSTVVMSQSGCCGVYTRERESGSR